MTEYKDKRTLSDWASFKGRIWRENFLENGTETAIGLFHERNVVYLEGAVRDFAKNVPKDRNSNKF